MPAEASARALALCPPQSCEIPIGRSLISMVPVARQAMICSPVKEQRLLIRSKMGPADILGPPGALLS